MCDKNTKYKINVSSRCARGYLLAYDVFELSCSIPIYSLNVVEREKVFATTKNLRQSALVFMNMTDYFKNSTLCGIFHQLLMKRQAYEILLLPTLIFEDLSSH